MNTPRFETMSRLRPGYRALVIGCRGAIGSAWMALLQQDPRCSEVLGLSRDGDPGFDLETPARLQTLAADARTRGPWHLVLDATGALTLHGVGPEKRLEDLDAAALHAQFAVNAIGPALLLKHLWPQMATGERVIWAKLSARVGSITDNRKGGWYGYRASKAALNMLLQTAAIEVQRRRPDAVIAALQPGTVRSRLSAPFAPADALDPAESAGRLLRVLDDLQPQVGAHFVDHQGQTIPW